MWRKLRKRSSASRNDVSSEIDGALEGLSVRPSGLEAFDDPFT